MKVFFGIFIFFALTGSAKADIEPPIAPIHLTLEQSVSEVIRNSTTVLKTENSDHLNATAVLQSYAQFLPNLAAGANYGYTSGTTLYTISGLNQVQSRYNGAQFDVTSTLNLFNGLSDLASFKGAADRKRASEMSVNWAKQQVALDITQSYLQVILDQELEEIAKQNLATSRARLALLQAQSEIGSVSTADLFRQQAQTSSDEQFWLNAETKSVNDQLIVIQKLRFDPAQNYVLDSPPLVPENLPELKEDMSVLISDALGARQDYQAQQEVLAATHWDVKRSQALYYPRLDLNFERLASGTYLHQLTVNGFDAMPPFQQNLSSQLSNQVEYTVTLSLTWNIFDRFTTRLNEVQTRVVEDNTMIDRDNLRIEVAAEIKQVINNYQDARRQMESTEVGLKAASKAYAVIQGRYQVGSSSFIDLLSSQSAFVQAQSAQAQALINLKLQERLVKYYLGKYKLT